MKNLRATMALWVIGGVFWTVSSHAQETAKPAEATRSEDVRSPPEAVPREERRSSVRPAVRSSHTVDVIGPGEKVESIIGRMRMDRAARIPEDRGANTARPPLQRPGGGRPGGGGGGSPGGEHKRGQEGSRPGPTLPR